MTSYAGTFALAAGLLAALAGIGLWGREATSGGMRGLARLATWLMLLSAVGAVVVLEWALLTHDFSVRFVAENGSLATPLYYTVTSLWAGSDGSLLLWLLVLTGYVAVVALRRPPPVPGMHAWAMAVLSTVTAFFFGLVLLTGHAFDAVVPPPGGGPGPNPLLQDHPAMGIHPPLLYAGLLGLAVPFAFAVAALITGDVGRDWLDAVRTYTLVAWVALTAGIVMGAWWSYAVLGWGGYWAWDPVENASFVPWLVATALLHSGMVQRRRAALPAWNLSLATVAFLLACLGTFLTRSSVVVSVHAFAESPMGPLLLGFVTALAVGVAVLVLLRADRLGAPRSIGPALSRGSVLIVNNILLGCLALTVLLGTLFPLFAEVVTHEGVSVGPPYYNRMAVPIALVLLVLMVVGPVMRWQGDRPERLVRRLTAPVTAGSATVVVLAAAGAHGGAALTAFGLAAAVAVMVTADFAAASRHIRAVHGCGAPRAVARCLVQRRPRNGGLLAHLGVAVAVVGIAASSAYTVSAQQRLGLGERLSVSGFTARLGGIHRDRTDRAMTTSARLRVRAGDEAATTEAGLAFYPSHGMAVARPAVLSGPTGDVYLTLLAVDERSRTATVRLAVNPMVGWIWAGGVLMALGGVIALWPPRRARSRPEAAQAPQRQTALQAVPR